MFDILSQFTQLVEPVSIDEGYMDITDSYELGSPLQIAQTISEEEVIRGAHISAPTRVRRFLSRFMVVIVVSLAIEGLVATFKAIHEDMAHLTYAASLLVSVGLLLAGWGIFIRLNRYAEELEPEAMEAAKREDRKLK